MSTDAFLEIDDIAGESRDAVHHGKIEIVHWGWGMSQKGSAHSGTGAGSGKVTVQDITVVKYSDRSSPNLIKLCCSGKHFKQAQLIVRKAGGAKPVEYVKLRMTNGMVSSFAVRGRPQSERLTETVTLNFESYTYEYTPQSSTGVAMATIPASWNMAKNAPA